MTWLVDMFAAIWGCLWVVIDVYLFVVVARMCRNAAANSKSLPFARKCCKCYGSPQLCIPGNQLVLLASGAFVLRQMIEVMARVYWWLYPSNAAGYVVSKTIIIVFEAISMTLLQLTFISRLYEALYETSYQYPCAVYAILVGILVTYVLGSVVSVLTFLVGWMDIFILAFIVAVMCTIVETITVTTLLARKLRRIATSAGIATLLDAEAKLTILGMTALGSTSLLYVSMVGFFLVWGWKSYFYFISAALYSMDSGINIFCLLCTFQGCESHYSMVFAKLHKCVMRELQTEYSPKNFSMGAVAGGRVPVGSTTATLDEQSYPPRKITITTTT